MTLQQAVKDLQDNLVVIAEIERRQSALIKDSAERITLVEENFFKMQQIQVLIQATQARTDLKLEELTDKLNGLIGYLDGR